MVASDGLEFTTLLPQPPECWNTAVCCQAMPDVDLAFMKGHNLCGRFESVPKPDILPNSSRLPSLALPSPPLHTSGCFSELHLRVVSGLILYFGAW